MIFVVWGFWSVWVCGYSRRKRGDQQEGLDRPDKGVQVLEEVHGGQGKARSPDKQSRLEGKKSKANALEIVPKLFSHLGKGSKIHPQ